MRLKFLFFPIMLVISLSIFFGYIWPEMDNLKAANSEKISHQGALNVISEKKAAIQQIDDEMDKDTEGEKIINDYLPSSKVEERIITGINFLATDSGVSLVNISLKDAAVEVASASAPVAVVDPVESQAASLAAASKTLLSTEEKDPAAIAADNLRFTEADISISGEYSKIRLFVDQVQSMSILNSIKSLNISSQSSEEETQAEPILSASVVVDFGYMDLSKIDNQKIANFKPGLDNSTIAVVKQYVSRKSPEVEKFGNKDGKKNPFLQ